MLKPVLDYPLDAVPDPGSMLHVSDQIRWLRLPLPMALNHINLWILGDADAWDLVDTGVNTGESRAHWERLLSSSLDPDRLNRIIVTHMHPDHAGLAGFLQERSDAQFLMSRSEYLMCRMLTADPPGKPPEVALNFYRRAGFGDAQIAEYEKRFGTFGAVIWPLPLSFRRLQRGQRLTSGGREWLLLEGRGHSPEHICLYCESDNTLISGDQILPTITSNVSVWPTEPDADPLADWLDSCDRLCSIIDNQTLVLPSHGKPFRGGRSRLEWLIHHHQDQLERTLKTCAEPATVKQVISSLFRRKLSGTDMVMAAGEALAHLNYLVHRGELVADRSGPVNHYQRC